MHICSTQDKGKKRNGLLVTFMHACQCKHTHAHVSQKRAHTNTKRMKVEGEKDPSLYSTCRHNDG